MIFPANRFLLDKQTGSTACPLPSANGLKVGTTACSCLSRTGRYPLFRLGSARAIFRDESPRGAPCHRRGKLHLSLSSPVINLCRLPASSLDRTSCPNK